MGIFGINYVWVYLCVCLLTLLSVCDHICVPACSYIDALFSMYTAVCLHLTYAHAFTQRLLNYKIDYEEQV